MATRPPSVCSLLTLHSPYWAVLSPSVYSWKGPHSSHTLSQSQHTWEGELLGTGLSLSLPDCTATSGVLLALSHV